MRGLETNIHSNGQFSNMNLDFNQNELPADWHLLDHETARRMESELVTHK